GRGLLSKDGAEKVRSEADAEVLEARERFRKIAKARPREVFDHLYKVTPSELEDQRNEYLSRLDRKGVD
ncbi:MAG: hypothetical protein P8J89_05535, partial [Phycisphaerales bacterium]|nr:hypothetical protein [Phycisphaerales bacterium]